MKSDGWQEWRSLMKAKKWIGEIIPYLLVAVLTIIVLCILYHGIDITRPLIYSGDGVSATYLVKSIDDTGWFLENPYVGGKYGGNWADYTMCDNLSFLLVKFFCLFSNNCFLIFNLFYFSTFVLVALTAYAVFRALKANRMIGIAGSLLYAFLAYHQMRISHIWLTPYFMAPLAILVGLWIATDAYGVDGWKGKKWLRNRKLIASTVILFLSAFTGFYYAFFTCIVICISGVILLLKKRSFRRVLLVLYSLFAVCAGVIANVYPSLIYWMHHGQNASSELAIRNASDAEVYALKLIQLLMPRAGHRLAGLQRMAAEYFQEYPLNNENQTATLGIVAGVGFVLLLVLLFKERVKVKYISEIKLLNIGVLLTAVIGGIGGVFSFFISTPMRCYNRLSIYIAFLSLLAVALFSTRLLEKIERKTVRRLVCAAASILVLAVGLWDQTESFGAVHQAVATQSFDNDKNFVQKIEEKMPAGTMVYQLPLIRFPSGGSYELYKGYMHSTQTVWSFGGMQGREEDIWETNLMNYSVNELLDHLCYGGYRGLYIDKELFEDRGFDFEFYYQKLQMFVTEKPIISEDQRLYFYDLTGYYEKIVDALGEKAVKAREDVEYKVLTEYTQGFYEKEETLMGISRWGEKNGTITVTCKGKKRSHFRLEGTLYSGYEEDSQMTVSVNGKKHTITFNKEGADFSIPVELKRGKNTISFESDAKDIKVKDEERNLNYNLTNPILRYTKG